MNIVNNHILVILCRRPSLYRLQQSHQRKVIGLTTKFFKIDVAWPRGETCSEWRTEGLAAIVNNISLFSFR